MEEKDSVNLIDATHKLDNPLNSINILDLNDDCLIQIFQQLNILDRLRFERVCKRWQVLLKASWHDVNILRLDNKKWGFKKPSDLSTLSSRNLKKVLSRCGQYVTGIEFEEPFKKLGPSVLGSIAKHCPNIQYIFAPEVQFKPASLKVLANRCTKITKLLLGNSTNDCDEELAMLFRSNEKLEAVYFGYNNKITGECLSALNTDNIRTVYFENCINISLKYFSVCRNFKNLSTLALEHFHDTSNEATEDISECFQSLKKFIVTWCPIYPFSPIQTAKLNNIKVLDLSKNGSITDDLLVTVGNNCKMLEKVDVSHCISVTNRGLAAILALPGLEILHAEMLPGINDEVFNCAPNLVELKCNLCSNMKNDGISKLIKYSHKLKDLYLIECEKISNQLIEDAIEYTKKRDNDIVLNIYLSEGKVNLTEITNNSPLLKIVVAKVMYIYDYDFDGDDNDNNHDHHQHLIY